VVAPAVLATILYGDASTGVLTSECV